MSASPSIRPSTTRKRGSLGILLSWFDAQSSASGQEDSEGRRQVDWPRILPFIGIHLAALGVFWVGFSWTALLICMAAYAVRMFGITAFYHRYFSHRAFSASRPVQFLGALLGNAAAQRGPLWWAAHHRKHHKHADTAADVHSPSRDGFFWCHVGWWTDPKACTTDLDQVRDFAKYPELRWLDRFDVAAPIAFAAAIFGLGWLLEVLWPALGVSAWQSLIWGFFVSTVLLYHATFTINSLCHSFGSRRYATKDQSRNNSLLALITFGEGWHNNHHHYPVAARQGFFWWEFDLSYYGLRVLEACGLVSRLRPVPAEVRRGNGRRKEAA